MAKILFVGHEATRTGAPYVLLHLLRWLRKNTNIDCRLLLLRGGELEPEFAEVSQVSVLTPRRLVKNDIIARALRRCGVYRGLTNNSLARLRQRLVRQGVDLIYSNTALNGNIIASLAGAGCPIVTHVHELEYAFRHAIGNEGIQLMKESTSHFIAVSESVRKNMIENYSIPEEKIDLIYEFIPVQIVSSEQKTKVRREVRQELGIPSEDYIVGACGTIDWRKGADLFIQLASLISQRRFDRPVWFVWLGGAGVMEGVKYHQLCYDIRLLSLENLVKFPGARSDALKYISAFDVFVMTSREDPFPLVCLEA